VAGSHLPELLYGHPRYHEISTPKSKVQERGLPDKMG
jgi:hypothetical protein